jgi:WD40 repeat protein/class 3 adenylate cyclase
VAELPSGTLTFLFSDIEGSTRLLRQLREQYAKALSEHRQLMRAAFAEHGGEEMGTEGDAFFVVFRRASEGVAAAAAAQRALARHEWPDGTELRVRMGLNTGEPGVEEEGYFGLGLHLTARICSAAHGGQVLVSQSTCAVCQTEELDGIELRDLGEHRLKDFDRPERLFQLVIDGLWNDFDAPRTLDKQGADDVAFRGEVGTPYKGLEAFQPQDAEFFFGREELVADLAERLAQSSFLAVVGPSGSGKSSVVRAGLVPAIWSGAHGLTSRDWKVVIMTPGAHPLEELAVRLATERGVSPGTVLDDLRREPHNFCLAVRQLLLDQSPDAKVVLIIDQAEEAFTLCRDESERRTFIELLAHAAEEDAQTVVILSLRADFYGHCAAYPSLAALVQDHQALVGPMREGEIRRAIELPAAKARLTLEPGLASRILEDLGQEPGSLPLLSHALLETWSRREDGTMTVRSYVDSGGVRGAIARTADAVYEQLDPEQQQVARRIFLRLAEPGRGTEDTRRRASLGELLPGGDEQAAVEDVLDILARARLVTVGLNDVEVAHEALIREWPLLRRWLDEDREGLLIHRRLTDDSNEWTRFDRDPSQLYRGARLQAALEWEEERAGALSPTEREFLDASRAAQESELERSRRRQRRLLGVAITLAVLLALAVAAAVFAANQRSKAKREERSATARALVQAAQAALPQRLDLATLLGVEAERTHSTADGRSVVLTALQRAGRILHFLRGSGRPVNDVAFSRDGKLLASIGDDGRIRLWSAVTGAATGESFGSAGHGDSLAFGAGDVLASAGSGSGVRLWDAGRRAQIAQVSSATAADLSFIPDGRLLAGATENGVVIWDVAARRQVGSRLSTGGLPATQLAFSGDGRTLAVAGPQGVTLWNLRTHARVRELPIGSAAALAFSPDGGTLAIAPAAGPARLFSLRAVAASPAALPGSDATTALAFSPDGTRLAAARGRNVLLFDTQTRHTLPLALEGHTGTVNSLAFSADGRMLASASDDGTAILWDARRDPRATQLEGRGPPATAVAEAANGTFAAARGSDVDVWKNAADRVPDTIAAGGLLLDLNVSDDGKTLAASTQSGNVLVATLPGGQVRTLSPRSVSVTEPVIAVALSRDGKTVASSLQNGQVLLELASASKLGAALPNGTTQAPFAIDLALSSDDRILAAGRRDGTIALWNVDDRKLLGKPFGSQGDAVHSVSFSPDGSLLASTNGDVRVKLWDVGKREPAGEPLQADADLAAVRFSPDGRLVAAGTTKGTVVLFDLASRQQLGKPLAGHNGTVYSVAFAADGTRLISAGNDGRVLLWNVEPWASDDALSKRACDLVGRNLTRSEWETYLPGKSYRRTCDEWPAGP